MDIVFYIASQYLLERKKVEVLFVLDWWMWYSIAALRRGRD
jgi:hypothetical protein